jgi:thiopeptide-type bacteriocin biosynthesis protein
MKKHQAIPRDFYPGDRWVFFKIYGGLVTCDNLLFNKIFPLAMRLTKAGVVKKWFYIRYSDPRYHLRVRFELSSPECFAGVVESMNRAIAPLCRKRLLDKMVIDTYRREIERYAENMMETSESLFCHESICICTVLKHLAKTGRLDNRWMIAFRLAESMLSSFGLALEEKYNLSKRMRQSMLKEFGFDEHNQKPLNERYRTLRKDIMNSVEGVFDKPVESAIDNYAHAISDTLEMDAKRDLNITSHIHMMNNRLFAGHSRFHETVLYFCLSRFYESQLARIKYNK